MPLIFISYRRSDAAGHAGRLYDRLVDRFGQASVFKDLDSMEPGADFVEVIQETVARCDAVIAVIGRDWMAGEPGGGRLEDPQDWVRIEIASALKRRIRVIPVLVERATMPSGEQLPEDLQPLARRHAVELTDSGWTAQVNQLIDALATVRARASAHAAPMRSDAARESHGGEGRRKTEAKAASRTEHEPSRSPIGASAERRSHPGAREPASPETAGTAPSTTRPTRAVESARELARVMHDSWVRGVAFSPDGRRIATAGGDRTARVWDSASGHELARVAHDDPVWGVAFSPDGTRIATAGGDKTARVWDSASGHELARVAHDDAVRGVAFSPDGTRIATASDDRTARVWDSADGRELARVRHDQWTLAVAFSPDGTRIATASDDKTARVWDSASGRELARVRHDRWTLGVAFSPDGTRIATASGDKTARVWDSASGHELARVPHDDGVWGVAFSPDGTRIATASDDKTARVWDSASGHELARVPHDDGVWGVAFSPDGTRIATATGGSTIQWRRFVATLLAISTGTEDYGYATVWAVQ